jgi:hypothetical protein
MQKPMPKPINPHRIFMSIVNSVKRLADAYVAATTDLATVKQKLADALANDAADDAAIAAAQAAADAAQAKADALQATVDADVTEDADVEALIAATLPPVS